MGYCVIEGYPVLLTRERYERLFEEVGKDKGPEWRVDARISGAWGCEGATAVYELLKARYEESPRRFGEEWIKFDFEDAEARETIREVLEAYCDWSGTCSVAPKPWSYTERLAIEHGCSLAQPQSLVLELRHALRPRPWWRRFTHVVTHGDFVLNIDAAHVQRIVGAIHRFYIAYSDIVISFGENVEIGSYVPELLFHKLKSRRW